MRAPEEAQRELVRQWIEKADQDLSAADILLKSEGRLPSVIGFHAQQAVEKYLKSMLVRHQIYFPKTHDLELLLSRVASVEPAAAAAMKDAPMLTPFGVEARYPGDIPELLHGEEIRAVELAREARRVTLGILESYLAE